MARRHIAQAVLPGAASNLSSEPCIMEEILTTTASGESSRKTESGMEAETADLKKDQVGNQKDTIAKASSQENSAGQDVEGSIVSASEPSQDSGATTESLGEMRKCEFLVYG